MEITRRGFLRSMSIVALPQVANRAGAVPLRLQGINHVTLTVSDLQRSIDFYQALFGLTLQARQGSATATFRIGTGPQNLGLTTQPSSGDRRPRIDHFCLGLEEFDLDRVLASLAAHGIAKSDQRGAMRVQVRLRGPDAGGAPEGTPEVYVGDPDGVIVQLQHARYCGGAGPLGAECTSPSQSPNNGLITAVGFSHCTVSSSNAERTNRFYQDIFGVGIRSYQGPTAPMLAIGPGVEFLANSGRDPSRPIGLHHFCLRVPDFETDRVVKALESLGIKPRASQTGPVGPLQHYVTMRLPDRGGAPGGTPELYFTDPDGILVQLQDTSYCGGAGRLGEVCLPR